MRPLRPWSSKLWIIYIFKIRWPATKCAGPTACTSQISLPLFSQYHTRDTLSPDWSNQAAHHNYWQDAYCPEGPTWISWLCRINMLPSSRISSINMFPSWGNLVAHQKKMRQLWPWGPNMYHLVVACTQYILKRKHQIPFKELKCF